MTELPLVLIVDDQPDNLDILVNHLKDSGFRLAVSINGAEALELAAEQSPDLILLDIMMPGLNGFEVCERLKIQHATQDIPVIFMSALSDTENKVRGFELGAVDYITKPFQREEVLARINTHLTLHAQKQQLEAKNTQLQALNYQLMEQIQKRESAEEQLRIADERFETLSKYQASSLGLEGFIGEHDTVLSVIKEVQNLQQFSQTHILVLGESGTGKELISRAIHYGSSRKSKPFIAVNCSAIPAELADSEFFGHSKGAFTGANRDHHGFFVQADGGTLFLDEIGDLPLALQPKLLRVLEDGQVTPLGSERAQRVDVRVVTATNADLTRSIQQKQFRQDLYYRLCGYIIHLPALRERASDIPLLAQYFLHQLAEQMGKHTPTISDEAIHALSDYPFPGNIRELKNLIEYALIRSQGQTITKAHLHLSDPLFHDEPLEVSSPINLPANSVHKDESLLLSYAQQHGRIDNTTAQALLNVDHSRASYLLKKLHKSGQLERQGERRWSYYTPI
ncbi:sigma-54-dependent transcriptional regulator [Litoribrevibacter euphylliae]|uniref:Sigma-54-dependent transcriptional regulator n=1 Tax=Litoribrevibacter euphylliae TaxID=1834034 RepID=A0ABV7HHZ0_9GAMM